MAGSGLAGVQAEEQAAQKLRHVVFFKFAETATPEDIQRVEKAFAALPGKIEEIKEFEWGTNVSKEGHDQGYTHCFLVTFDAEEGRDAYLVHPAHDAFVAQLGGALAAVHVIDYWAKE